VFGAEDEDLFGDFKYGGWYLCYFDDVFRMWVFGNVMEVGVFLFGCCMYEVFVFYWLDVFEEE